MEALRIYGKPKSGAEFNCWLICKQPVSGSNPLVGSRFRSGAQVSAWFLGYLPVLFLNLVAEFPAHRRDQECLPRLSPYWALGPALSTASSSVRARPLAQASAKATASRPVWIRMSVSAFRLPTY